MINQAWSIKCVGVVLSDSLIKVPQSLTHFVTHLCISLRSVNSSRPGYAFIRHYAKSSLVEVMA